ncbi:hypothetical protein ABIF86_006170 [Bradyrhizobium japonicum]
MADFVAKAGCNRRMSFGHSVRPTGFDPPTLTREAPQILSDCSKNKLVLGAPWATKPKPTKPQDALQMRKPHLDLLALTSRRLESLGASERPGDVPGVLMYVARDLARWFFWTALRFKRTCVAVELARTIQKCLPPCTVPLVPSRFPAGAVVDVAGRIISKVAAREGTVISLRLVEHGDMWCDALRLDQPVQHRSSPVSGIPGKPLRLETKALLCSFDHCPRRSDLGLANSHPSGSLRAFAGTLQEIRQMV